MVIPIVWNRLYFAAEKKTDKKNIEEHFLVFKIILLISSFLMTMHRFRFNAFSAKAILI